MRREIRGALVLVLAAAPIRLAQAGREAREHRNVAPERPAPRLAKLRALGKGILESPGHTLGHLKNPRTLGLALASTAGLGMLVHATGVDVETVAQPVLAGVLTFRWARALPALRRSSGSERWRGVGRELFATTEIGAELMGVHVLEHPELAGGAGGPSVLEWVGAAGQGLLGFHELFYFRLRDQSHGDHGAHPTHEVRRREARRGAKDRSRR